MIRGAVNGMSAGITFWFHGSISNWNILFISTMTCGEIVKKFSQTMRELYDSFKMYQLQGIFISPVQATDTECLVKNLY